MKRLMLLSLVVVLLSGFTSSTPTTFVSGTEKQITFSAPAGCAAYQGELVLNNCTLVSIAETYDNKKVAVNGNKFVIYGLNAEEAEGANLVVTVLPSSYQSFDVGIVNALGASPEAEAVTIDTVSITFSSILDINGDGEVNTDDVTYAINEIYSSNATVQDLQAIINAVIAEME